MISVLKELVLWNLLNLSYICKDGFQLDPTLESLETLYVWECSKLLKLMPPSVSLNCLRYLEIKSCNNMVSLLSLATAKGLVLLNTLKIEKCNMIEEIISNDGHNEQEIEFSNLKVLELLELSSLKSFCSVNVEFMFPILRRAVVKGCPRMNTFTKGVSCMPKLRRVNIDANIESEQFWEGSINSTIKRVHADKVGYLSLESLNLSECSDVKAIWNDSLRHITFSRLRFLVIDDCELLSVIPCHLLQLLNRLEELKVSNCDSVEVIFDVEDMTRGVSPTAIPIQLRRLALSRLSRLKNVWSKDPKGTLNFESLQRVCVSDCQSLKNLFPALLAKSLVRLEELEIESCGVEEIVRMERGLEEPVKFLFPRLNHLKLWKLKKLKYFCPGNYILEWPNLTKLDLCIWSDVHVFNSKVVTFQATDAENGSEPLAQPALFLVEEVLPMVQELSLNCKDVLLEWFRQIPKSYLCRLKVLRLQFFDDEHITLPYWMLQNLPPLESLVLKFSSFQEIFPCVGAAAKDEQPEIVYDVKRLGLWGLPKLKCLCNEGSRLSVLENLESLCVWDCSNLIKLVPSFVSLNNIKYLEIQKCNGLTSLITLSTAKSLVQLAELRVEECALMEQIVMNDGHEENKIELRELKHLRLMFLPRLKCFWSFDLALSCPKLREVTIRGCTRMSTFIRGGLTTPELEKVQLDNDGIEFSWEGDLTVTVEMLFNTKVALSSLNHLELQELPELKDIWHGRLPDRAFCNLKTLVVEKCDFLSTVISINLLCNLKNLEELQVGNCDNVEAVFDVEGADCINGLKMPESFNLRVFTLNHLPSLKQVWKAVPECFSRFQKLQVVKVANCQNLNYLFPFSLAKVLLHLKELAIDSCNEMQEIIAREDASTVAVREFIFPIVTSVTLKKLPKFKNFCTIEWPRLRSIYTLSCENLAIFTTELNSSLEPDQSIETQRPLFSIGKVIPNLEELSLESRDATGIWRDQVAANLFAELKYLRLQSFHDENATFPYWFLEKVQSIRKLVVKYSSFEEIFLSKNLDDKEGQRKEGLPRLELLCLWALPRLVYICKDGFQLDPMLDDMEYLYIKECPLLTNIVPSSVSFSLLKHLEVWKCHGLISVMTFTTARSLVQLEEMKIDDCEAMQEIVDIEDKEGKHEIVLNKLKNLELKSLPCLENFCTKSCTFVLPSLIKVTVTKCPRMKVFSNGTTASPKLQQVMVDDADTHCWEGDLNSTIQKLFKDVQESS